jgi:hypothetical protein
MVFQEGVTTADYPLPSRWPRSTLEFVAGRSSAKPQELAQLFNGPIVTSVDRTHPGPPWIGRREHESKIRPRLAKPQFQPPGVHPSVIAKSPGQMRHFEPSVSSTMWLLACDLIRTAVPRLLADIFLEKEPHYE